MNINNAVISSMRSLNKNRTRSFLTTIGVIVGVSSVIMMAGIGNSARIVVKSKIYSYGKNAMQVRSDRIYIRMTDVEKIQKIIPDIKYISPLNENKSMSLKYRNRYMKTRVNAVNNDFLKLREYIIKQGREFNESDIQYNKKVVIIGDTVRAELFDTADCIGETIIVNRVPFYVIGTVESLGQAMSGRDLDNYVLVPYTTGGIKLFGNLNFRELYLSVKSESGVDGAYEILRNYFRTKHGLNQNDKDDFSILTSDEKLKITEYIWKSLTFLMIGVASISLIVGGVGIMNIMVVSVNERIREIGIRMAIGAKRQDILLQFLTESVILSAGGGIIGVLVGVVGYIIIVFSIDWPFVASFFPVFISFLFSIMVGVFFGYYPARRASLLNPIDALRHE